MQELRQKQSGTNQQKSHTLEGIKVETARTEIQALKSRRDVARTHTYQSATTLVLRPMIVKRKIHNCCVA